MQSCNVVNYDEKVIDGFYDVCGLDSTLVVPKKMPSLMELKAISPLENIGCEVVLVNRAVDIELRKLEERVYYMSIECHALDKTLNTRILVQKIADLIVDRLGGPVSDVEEMFRRWRARNHELQVYSNTAVLPLGALDVGHSRQRALLFKVVGSSPDHLCLFSTHVDIKHLRKNMITLNQCICARQHHCDRFLTNLLFLGTCRQGQPSMQASQR